MAADIINLRQARKIRARDAAAKEAEANRLTFGRTKAEKALTKAERELAAGRIEAHKRDRSDQDK